MLNFGILHYYIFPITYFISFKHESHEFYMPNIKYTSLNMYKLLCITPTYNICAHRFYFFHKSGETIISWFCVRVVLIGNHKLAVVKKVRYQLSYIFSDVGFYVKLFPK